MKTYCKITDGPATLEEQIAAVQAYAIMHYEHGWDWVVEATDRNQMIRMIGKAKTRWGAIYNVRNSVRIYADVSADIQGA